MQRIRFDFNNMFESAIGREHGIGEAELRSGLNACRKARQHLARLLENKQARLELGLEWAMLPYQDAATIRLIKRLGNEIAAQFENVLFLGIGGSYLGLKACQDALCAPYYNEFPAQRRGRPRIYFEGNNLDPETLSVLLKHLKPAKTFVVVISKSGETTETKAAFAVVEPWLKKGVGAAYGRQIFCITDPSGGALRKKINDEQRKDVQAFRNLPLLKGVGGRYSEFNMGLLHMAIVGINIEECLAGARAMARRCARKDLRTNPACMYALLHTMLYRKKHKPVTILMPFSEGLKSTADWYCQLLAESTGKKFPRLIQRGPDGRERWLHDTTKAVHVGRTPISTRGTNDLHSVQQNNIEGENDKTITFIRVEKFRRDIMVTGTGDFLSGNRYAKLLSLAQEATEWALVRQARPNCTIVMPQVSPYHWGELIFFFEMATAFEGELLNINAFDQPGVEGYKNYMYYQLRKPGLSGEIAASIRSHPLRKKARLII